MITRRSLVKWLAALPAIVGLGSTSKAIQMATPKTLLQIGNEVLNGIGLSSQPSFIGSTQPNAILVLALLNESGEEIRDYPEGSWTFFRNEFNIVIVPPVVTTGNITLNSPTITNIIPNTSGITAGVTAYSIAGNAIPVASRIKSIDSLNQITMTMSATGNSTAEAILFGQDLYPAPSDFKGFQNRTFWDRTNHWELLGPQSPQMDQWHRSGIVATGPRRYFRVIGHAANTFRIWPPPFEVVNPIQFAYEYFGTDWVNLLGTNLATAANFVNDTDTTYIDDRLLIRWGKWKFQEAKGMAFDTIRNDAIDYMKPLIARDGGGETLHMAKHVHSQFLSPSQVIDGSFPGSTGPNSS